VTKKIGYTCLSEIAYEITHSVGSGKNQQCILFDNKACHNRECTKFCVQREIY